MHLHMNPGTLLRGDLPRRPAIPAPPAAPRVPAAITGAGRYLEPVGLAEVHVESRAVGQHLAAAGHGAQDVGPHLGQLRHRGPHQLAGGRRVPRGWLPHGSAAPPRRRHVAVRCSRPASGGGKEGRGAGGPSRSACGAARVARQRCEKGAYGRVLVLTAEPVFRLMPIFNCDAEF